MISLQISTLGLSSTKVGRVLHYGDPKIDEEIFISPYDSKTITIEQITEMQNALDRRKRQEILRREYNHKKESN